MARIRTIKPEFWPNSQGFWQGDECHVYVVQEGKSNNIKIGIAANPIWRVSGLRGGNPRPLNLRAVYGGTRADCVMVEAAVLERVADCRLVGEWFRATPGAVIEFIDDLFCREEGDG